MIKYVNSAKRRLISYIVTILAVAVMVPAFYTFNSALEESRFKIQANKFITEHVSVLKFGEYLVESSEINYYNSGEKRQIILNPHGILNINSEIIFDLQNKVSNYPELNGVEIIVK